MSALGHFLEERGLPTVSISLVRLHTERIAPPRALWVPFELGRPLGAPGETAFQRQVLQRALDLFTRPHGPVLEDFDEDAPDADDIEGWACPIPLIAPEPESTTATRLLQEAAGLTSWYQLAKSQRGRTTFGVAGLEIEPLVDYVAKYAAGEEPDIPVPGMSTAEFLKLATEDIKAYYIEAIGAQPGMASSQQLQSWFWQQTEAGKCFIALQQRLRAAEDSKLKLLGTVLVVPYTERERLAPGS